MRFGDADAALAQEVAVGVLDAEGVVIGVVAAGIGRAEAGDGHRHRLGGQGHRSRRRRSRRAAAASHAGARRFGDRGRAAILRLACFAPFQQRPPPVPDVENGQQQQEEQKAQQQQRQQVRAACVGRRLIGGDRSHHARSQRAGGVARRGQPSAALAVDDGRRGHQTCPVAGIGGRLRQFAGQRIAAPTAQRSPQLLLVVVEGVEFGRVADVGRLILRQKGRRVGPGKLHREQPPAQHNEADEQPRDECHQCRQAGAFVNHVHSCHLPASILWIGFVEPFTRSIRRARLSAHFPPASAACSGSAL